MRALIASVLARLSLVRGDTHLNDRVGALNRAWGYVFTNQLVGDYYEFGVYRGESLIASFKQYQAFVRWLNGQLASGEPWRRKVAAAFASEQPVRFIGCDTFSGLPDNAEGVASFGAGHYACDVKTVAAACRAAGVEPLTLVKGLFADTFVEVRSAGRKASIIYLDGDLYQSACDALESVTPLVQQGTVLMCDDYRAFNNDPRKGERRALTEWCERTGITAEPWFAYQFAGQAFLLNV